MHEGGRYCHSNFRFTYSKQTSDAVLETRKSIIIAMALGCIDIIIVTAGIAGLTLSLGGSRSSLAYSLARP